MAPTLEELVGSLDQIEEAHMKRGASAGEEPYLQIARDLQDRIKAPHPEPGYRPGEKLPSLSELGRRFGHTQVTVKRAYEVLINGGLVVSVPKVGYFVRRYPRLRYQMAQTHDPQRLIDLPSVDGWTTDVEAAGYLAQQDITVKSVLGREAIDVYTVGELLDIGEDDVAVVRARVRSIAMDPDKPEFDPESLADTYYPIALARGTELMDPEGVNTTKVLAAAGYPQVDFDHEMLARQPSEDEARRLRLPRGSAVMERITVARDPRGRPVYVQHVVTAGNGSRFLFKMRYQEG